jgi:hypothetical protein
MEVDIALGEADPYRLARIPEAWSNWPALRMLFATFVLCATLLALVAGEPAVIVALTTLAAALVALVGVTAGGTQFMQQARREPVSRARVALVASPAAVLRTIGLAGVVVLGLGAFSLAAVLVLLLCRIPLLGSILYIAALPVLTLAGAVVAVAAAAVFALSAAAIWNGATVRQALTACRAIVTRRRGETATHFGMLALFAAVVVAITMPLVSAAFGVTVTLSAMVLAPGAIGTGSLQGALTHPELLGPGAFGTALLLGAVTSMLVAGLQLGLSLAYLRLSQGLEVGTANVRAAPACPACTRPVYAEDAFCSHCGQALR